MEILSLFDAIDQLEDIFYDIKYSLKESKDLRKLQRLHLVEFDDQTEKTWLSFDAGQLLAKVNNYRNSLRHYRQNYRKYDKTNSIQENDSQITTSKFFDEVVTPLRSKAISSLKQLKRMIANSNMQNEKDTLEVVMNRLVLSTNELIDACIRVIEISKPNLVRNLKTFGIDFKNKYNLVYVDLNSI